jgi:hypothetical protein
MNGRSLQGLLLGEARIKLPYAVFPIYVVAVLYENVLEKNELEVRLFPNRLTGYRNSQRLWYYSECSWFLLSKTCRRRKRLVSWVVSYNFNAKESGHI